MPDNAGGTDMVDGLVTDPTLFPSWGNPGDQIFKWTDDQGTEYFVTASVFRLLNQPWRGQKNVTGVRRGPGHTHLRPEATEKR